MANPILGAVSLTDKNGLFLGSVNLNNLNANSGDLLYSPNGFDLSGLAVSDGLSSNGSQISTTGNPAIQLTSNSIYVNDNVSSIQTAIDNSTQADCIYISSGSYGETVNITDKYNISLINPSCNNGTICEVLNGLSLTGSSELIRLSNLSIKGSVCEFKGVGRHLFNNVVFSGTNVIPLALTIGQGSTNYMTFTNCEFNQYVNLVVDATFASVVYFINCNFAGCSITLNQVSPLQVIFNNCAGFQAFPSPLQSTSVGMNVLADGSVLQCTATQLNGIKSFILQDGTDTLSSVNQALATNGVSGLKLVNLPDSVLRFVTSESGNYASTATGNPLTLFSKVGQASVIPNKPSLLQFTINFQLSGGQDVLTLDLVDDTNTAVLQSLKFSIPAGENTISSTFNFTFPNNYTLDYSIVGSVATHNLNYNTNMSYAIAMYQNNN